MGRRVDGTPRPPNSAALLLEPELDAKIDEPNFLTAEWNICQHPLKLSSRISPLQQHEPKCGEGHPAVDRAQPDRAEVLPDFGHRHVLTQVQHQRRAAWA